MTNFDPNDPRWGDHKALIDWLCETPSDMIPTDDAVREVLARLRARPDAADSVIVESIRLCESYLKGQI